MTQVGGVSPKYLKIVQRRNIPEKTSKKIQPGISTGVPGSLNLSLGFVWWVGETTATIFPVCHSRTLATWGIFVFASPHLPPPVTKELDRKKNRISPNFSRCWRKNAPK